MTRKSSAGNSHECYRCTQRETQSYTKSEGENNDPVREGLRLAYICDIYYAPTILRTHFGCLFKPQSEFRRTLREETQR